jgi:hypothetical protein
MGIETMMAIGTVASIGGTIAGGIGGQKSLQSQSDEAAYRAQVAANNKIIAEQNARYAVQAGRTNAQAQDFQTRAALGQATAAQGASGIDVASGSPVDVRSSIQQLGRLKTLDEIQKADLEAYGYKQKASDFGAEAGLQQFKAQSAQAAKGPAAFGTLLGGASALGDKWLRFKGGFGGGQGGYAGLSAGELGGLGVPGYGGY